MFKNILVPTDGSELADKAVTVAIDTAQKYGGKIIGLSVAEPYPFSPLADSAFVPEAGPYEAKMRDVAESHVQKIAAAAKAANVPCETVIGSSFTPYEEIIRTAEKNNCDVIFMASHGRRGLNKLFLGSETQKVLAHSEIPVLVLR